MTTKSTTSRPARKSRQAAKFPLCKHIARGYWYKKIRGKLHYFGKIADDPDGQAALARYLEVKDDLIAGRTPRVSGDGLRVADLCNRYLSSKRQKLVAGASAAW